MAGELVVAGSPIFFCSKCRNSPEIGDTGPSVEGPAVMTFNSTAESTMNELRIARYFLRVRTGGPSSFRLEHRGQLYVPPFSALRVVQRNLCAWYQMQRARSSRKKERKKKTGPGQNRSVRRWEGGGGRREDV